MDEANPKKKRCRRPQPQAINLSNTLPHDTMLDILSRLPVKSLIRFQSVSNSWKNFIRDPFFIKLHSDYQRKNNKLVERFIISTNDCMGELFSLDYKGNYFTKIINKPIAYPKVSGWKIWGSCNGLLLIEGIFSLGAFIYMYIWNPSTAEIIQLPSYRSTPLPGGSFSQYSIFYNYNINDYEVIRIAPVSCSPPLSEVMVYSLQKKSWRKINNIRYVIFKCKSGVFVKGSLYWIVRPNCVGGTKVVAFNIGGGHFREVKLCDELLETDVFRLVIAAYKEKLCVLHDRKFRESYELWVRNDYGVKETWEKKYDIMKLGRVSFAEYLVSFTNKGEAILRMGDARFMLYEPQQSCCEMVGFEVEKEKDRNSATYNEKPGLAVWYGARAQPTVAVSACTYVESLVRLAAN